MVSPPTNTNTTTLINKSLAVNQAHNWIENPVVTTIPFDSSGSTKFAAMFDWVQGGGERAGSALPYLGFSWSDDGKSWPAEHGELVSVEPEQSGSRQIWTDLVRTPTALIPEDDGTFTIFYAARDTHNASSHTNNATQPYTNCSVPPSRVNRHVDRSHLHAGREPAVGSAPPPPPPGWSDGCFWGVGMLRVKLDLTN